MGYDRKRANKHRTNHKRCPACKKLRRYRDHNSWRSRGAVNAPGQWALGPDDRLICPACAKKGEASGRGAATSAQGA